jgi:hypothetical protein
LGGNLGDGGKRNASYKYAPTMLFQEPERIEGPGAVAERGVSGYDKVVRNATMRC